MKVYFLKKLKNLAIQIIWSFSRRLYQISRKDIPTKGISKSENYVIKTFLKNKTNVDYIFDVGANVGLWSKLASSIRKDLNIYSFEPIKSTYNNLEKNLKDYENISTINKALSSESGFFNIYNYGENSGTNSFYNFNNDKNQEFVIESIEATTIDLFCETNQLKNVDFIKCDTEGNDLKVILGALKMIENNKIGILQFEYNWRWILSNSSLKNVFDVIEGKDYYFGKVINNEIQIIEAWNQEIDKFYEANYILISKSYIKYLNCRFYYYNKRNILVEK